MKRSTQIGLAAAGVVLVATYWSLSGGETDDSLVYNNAAECRAANQLSASQCEQRFNEASANHLRDAKKFTSSASCEQEFDASGCQSATWNNAQVFIPALAGIMLARQFMSGGGAAQPLYRQPAQPVRPALASPAPAGRNASSRHAARRLHRPAAATMAAAAAARAPIRPHRARRWSRATSPRRGWRARRASPRAAASARPRALSPHPLRPKSS